MDRLKSGHLCLAFSQVKCQLLRGVVDPIIKGFSLPQLGRLSNQILDKTLTDSTLHCSNEESIYAH